MILLRSTGSIQLFSSVKQAYRKDTSFQIDNHRSPSVGSIQGTLHAAHWNLTGRGDALDLRYEKTEGVDDVAVAYTLPLSSRGTTLGLAYRRAEADVVEKPFDELDISSEYQDWVVSLRHPLLHTIERLFDVSLDLNYRRSETFLLGQPFSFSPGVQDGETRLMVLRLGANWVERWPDQVISLHSTLSWGLDAFDATIDDDLPDGEFFSWLGQAQWARRFGANRNEVRFYTAVQLASEALLPLEQFAVGGPFSVRGYRRNLLVRDNGWVGSLEFQFPILPARTGNDRFRLAAFADYGRSWNVDGPTPDPESISSVGLGLLWDLPPYWHAELYGAVPFRDVEVAERGLQDSGIHFRLSYRLF